MTTYVSIKKRRNAWIIEVPFLGTVDWSGSLLRTSTEGHTARFVTRREARLFAKLHKWRVGA